MSREWTDEELVSYIESHSRTEVALVSNAHVRRFLDLAGEKMPEHLAHRAFIHCYHDDIRELIVAARRRMRIKLVPPPSDAPPGEGLEDGPPHGGDGPPAQAQEPVDGVRGDGQEGSPHPRS